MSSLGYSYSSTEKSYTGSKLSLINKLFGIFVVDFSNCISERKSILLTQETTFLKFGSRHKMWMTTSPVIFIKSGYYCLELKKEESQFKMRLIVNASITIQ